MTPTQRGQHVPQDLAELAAVVVGDHHVGVPAEHGGVEPGRLRAGQHDAGQPAIGLAQPGRLRLDQHGAEADVPGEVQQAATDRGGEDHDHGAPVGRPRQVAMCHRAGRILRPGTIVASHHAS